jgi:hypothetical protein
MSKHHLGFLPSDGGAEGTAVLENVRVEVEREVPPATMDDYSSLPAADRAQLERDIAAIERASAALRRAEPALESWRDQPTTPAPKPRPLWLLIGVLWLSTALVTLGAVFAISALVG